VCPGLKLRPAAEQGVYLKVRMFLIGLALAAVLMVPAASAQESFLLASTYGLFANDIDCFMDPNDYKDVEFDTAFGVIQGGSYRDTDPRFLDKKRRSINGIAAGFATRIKDTYLGFYFDGNLWSGEALTAYDKDNKLVAPTLEQGVAFNGYFAALLGLKFGGLKLVLDFENVRLQYDENKASEEWVKAYSTGFTTVGLDWGSNFDFKGGRLDPEIYLAYRISNTYSYEKGGKTDYSYIPPGFDYFDTMSHLIFSPGADYYFPEDKGHLFAFYELDIGIHPSEVVSLATTNTTIKWEGYDVANTLGLGYDRVFEINSQFSFGIGGGIDLSIESSQAKYNVNNGGGRYNGDAEISFGISPYVEIGGVYNFSKAPFSLYTGLQFASYESDGDGTERTDWWNLTSAKSNDGQINTGTFKNLGVDLGLGIGFTPFKNFSVDASFSKWVGTYIKDDLSYDGHDDEFWKNDLKFAIQATLKL
jgi:hypothetical protein